MTRFIKAAVFGLILLATPHWASASDFSQNDAARYLAGMPPSPESPLAKFTRDATWQQHAKFFDTAWHELDRRQISKVRSWSAENLKDPQRTLFYMFSGPDFLYANAFFPNASTYVFAGLEPVGPLPAITDRTRYSLANLRASLNTILHLSFFITSEMSSRLREGELKGTLPILYVFLARSGKTIKDVTLVNLDKDGIAHAAAQAGAPLRGAPRVEQGVKIVFSSADGTEHTLYYFSTDLSDSGVKNSGLLNFMEKLGTGDGLIKSASYLLHGQNFSKIRQFLLDHTQSFVQDDSGIPVRFFKTEDWQLKPFGAYLGPIEVFPGMFQPQLQTLFRQGRPPKLDFGIGYRWRGHDSNLLLAVKKSVVARERLTQ